MRAFMWIGGLRTRLKYSWKLLGLATLLTSLVLSLGATVLRSNPDREPGSRLVLTVDGGPHLSFQMGQGRPIVAAGDNVRDAYRNKLLYKFPSQRMKGYGVFSPDGKIIATFTHFFHGEGFTDDPPTELHLRNAESGAILALLHSDPGYVWGPMAFSPDSGLLVIVLKGKLVFWDTRTFKEVRRWAFDVGGSLGLGSLIFHPNGKMVIGALGGEAYFWDAETGKLLRTLGKPLRGSLCLAISPDGRLLAGGHTQGGRRLSMYEYTSPIRLWELPSGKEVAVLPGHETGWIERVAFRRNGRWLASASRDKTVKIWDIPKRELRYTLQLESAAFDVAFSPDDRWLATGEDRGIVKLWDIVPDSQ